MTDILWLIIFDACVFSAGFVLGAYWAAYGPQRRA